MSWYLQTVVIGAACILFKWTTTTYAEENFSKSAVFIQVGYENGDAFTKVEEGSGFIINSKGWVLTANHVINANVPVGKQKIIYGSLGSRYEYRNQLFEIPTVSVSADIGLLRFSPALDKNWPHLKIVPNHAFSTKDYVAAAGFPNGGEIETRPGKVTNLFGPKGYIGVNVGLAPGMSGGPVVIENSKCVVGLVAAGSGTANFDYIVPVQYVKSLLDIPPAEYVTEVALPTSNGNEASSPLYERSYQVDQTKDNHEITKTSQYYDFKFEADPGSNIVSARYAESSAASAADKNINISPDRKSVTFKVKLESGPIYDQTRGWWHGQIILTQQKTDSVNASNALDAVRKSCQ